MKINELLNDLNTGKFDEKFRLLYGELEISRQKNRYMTAVKRFMEFYPNHNDIKIYSASGRTEIGGNHTDHQHGCVIAAAVNLDVIGVTSFHNDGVIRIKSKGYKEFEVAINDLSVHENENSSSAIVRGIASKFTEMGIKIGGFDMYTTSDVLSGSGISSSAAFENLISVAIDQYYNSGKAGAVEIAKIGQYAENVYFGKKSGLMDQLVSAVGGFVFIDFKDIENPSVEQIDFDFRSIGYEIVITDTKGSHSNLTDDYVAVRTEMEAIASFFGKKVLRQIDEQDFQSNISVLRRSVSDRAVLRAAHFFAENKRARMEAQSLKNNDFPKFLALVQQSGDSSANYLQNLYSVKNPTRQEIPLAIMLGKNVLDNSGAIRVHGGGFAGTIQAFVPENLLEKYIKTMNEVYGSDSCYVLSVRPYGGMEII
jgi:galactokinase